LFAALEYNINMLLGYTLMLKTCPTYMDMY